MVRIGLTEIPNSRCSPSVSFSDMSTELDKNISD
jgi:hypothetical protein